LIFFLEISEELKKRMKINFIFACFCLIKTVFSSYILYPEDVYFADAVKKCDSINATVVLPKNETENDFILNNYLNNASVTRGIWLAIYDFIGNETNVNYYTNQTLLYTNWASREPGSKNEYCTSYTKTRQWHDYSCSSNFSVLCKIGTTEVSSTTITTTQTIISVSNKINIPIWKKWFPW
jgi:hypothetical protein